MALAFIATGCGAPESPPPADPGDTGQAVFDLLLVPPDARCIELMISGQGQSFERRFDVAAEKSSTLVLDGLPFGTLTFTELVFSAACAQAAERSLTWFSDPTTVVIAAGLPAGVHITLHHVGPGGRAVVTSDFPVESRIDEFVFDTFTQPQGIAAGPDGNLWFGATGNVGRITPAGEVTFFPLPAPATIAFGITAGSDGNLWFVTFGALIGRITPDGASITLFQVPPAAGAKEIAAGSDGNLWFPDINDNAIGRITPEGEFTTFPIPTPFADPNGIAAGPDGNIWFTERTGNAIGRATTGGAFTEFPVPDAANSLFDITEGPDGALWFTETRNVIGRITVDGVLSQIELRPGSSSPPFNPPPFMPLAITSGPGDAVYFTTFNATPSVIGRVAPDGTVTTFAIPTSGAASFGITTGPDGNVWFTENFNARIGKLRVAF